MLDGLKYIHKYTDVHICKYTYRHTEIETEIEIETERYTVLFTIARMQKSEQRESMQHNSIQKSITA